MKCALPTPAQALAPCLAAAALIAAAPAPASADSRCGPRAEVIRQLESRYGETQHSVGLQEGRGVIEVFANPESGSWTILLTTPQGLTCLMAAGEAYQAVRPARAERPA